MSIIGKFALGIINDLILSIISDSITQKIDDFFKIRKIKSRVEDTIADVVESLLPLFSSEGIPEDKQYHLFETCVDELKIFIDNPEKLFLYSLNGQKIFDELYKSKKLPQVIIEDDLINLYSLLFPRIATLVCKIPEIIKSWENDAWAENFKRFDEISKDLQNLISAVDKLKINPSNKSEDNLGLVRMALAQKIRFDLDLTGLRGDSPLSSKFDNCFVHPEIVEQTQKKKEPRLIDTPAKSLDYLIYQDCRTIIVAPPGAGKSTWTKWLQRELLSPKWSGISIRFELRRLSNEPIYTIYDLIKDTIGKHFSESLNQDCIDQWICNKKIVFILDGFDEIRPNDRDKIYEWIIDLSIAARECPFIVTSRPLTTNHLELFNNKWTRWSIESFDLNRIIDYIDRWYRYTPLLEGNSRSIEPLELAQSWQADPTICPLTGNPLLLSTLLMVHHLDGSLPNGRSQLYKRYVDGMLGLWDDRRKVNAEDIKLTLEQKKQVLRSLALYMFLIDKDQVDETIINDWMIDILQVERITFSADEVLLNLRERSGLIIGPGVYSFIHKSVAEYLVAETVYNGNKRDISNERIDRFYLFENRENDRWNTVIFLWIGLASASDVESFIEQCLKAKSFRLGYGILLDQCKRISSNDCRNFILNAVNLHDLNNLLQKENHFNFWIFCHPENMKSQLTVPDFRLRDITNRVSYFELIFKLIDDNIINWSDFNNTNGKFRELLWMIFIIKLKNFNEWQECLECFPFNENRLGWMLWIIERIPHTNFDGKTLSDVLEVIHKTYPKYSGIVPIGLISTCVSSLKENAEYTTIVKYILEALPNSNKGIIDKKVLIGTNKWDFGFYKNPAEPSTDLFEQFINEINNLINQGLIDNDNVAHQAIDFVTKLKNTREQISIL